MEICAYWPRLHVSFRLPSPSTEFDRYPGIRQRLGWRGRRISEWLPNFSRLEDSTFQSPLYASLDRIHISLRTRFILSE